MQIDKDLIDRLKQTWKPPFTSDYKVTMPLHALCMRTVAIKDSDNKIVCHVPITVLRKDEDVYLDQEKTNEHVNLVLGLLNAGYTALTLGRVTETK